MGQRDQRALLGLSLRISDSILGNGGQRGIRTLETVSRLHAFQACAFNHSATCPCRDAAFDAPPWVGGCRRRCGAARNMAAPAMATDGAAWPADHPPSARAIRASLSNTPLIHQSTGLRQSPQLGGREVLFGGFSGALDRNPDRWLQGRPHKRSRPVMHPRHGAPPWF